jgi:hypothetical protein
MPLISELYSRWRSRLAGKPEYKSNTVVWIQNPYHAVSVQAAGGTCAPAAALAGRRFLAREAPALPLAGCSTARCTCVYKHHDDRRVGPRRATDRARSSLRDQHLHNPERRDQPGGRRATDRVA